MSAIEYGPERTLRLLLPARSRLRGKEALPVRLAQLIRRGDRLPSREDGREAQLLRVFDVTPSAIADAPLTRQLDAEDAGDHVWVRADPAHVRADMSYARMLACGDLGLSATEVEALLAALAPLFAEAGWPISAPTPGRWYLQLPPGTGVPALASPEAVLGDDLHAHMPQGDAGRGWRRLLNEAQVVLHNHPVNIARAELGQLTLNSLWFWGAGTLPTRVQADACRIASADPLVAALAKLAAIPYSEPFAGALSQVHGPNVVDLTALRDLAEFDAKWLPRAQSALGRGRFEHLLLDLADGAQFTLRTANPWRVWRRSDVRLA